MNVGSTRECWIVSLCLAAASLAGATPAAPSAAKPAASAASGPAATASSAAAADIAGSIKVKVVYAEAAGQPARLSVGAVVRLKGSDQTFTTNANGVAEVFGTLGSKAVLTVIVVNANICNLPLAGRKAGASATVVVPKRGQGKCRFEA